MNKQGKGKIEYLDYTWNPITGCMHPCKDQYCYAARMAHRFGETEWRTYNEYGIGQSYPYIGNDDQKETDRSIHVLTQKPIVSYPFGFEPTFHRYRLNEPQKVKKPSIIGVVYMGDLFGDWVPDEWIEEVFKTCEAASWHTYIFLTKNPNKMAATVANHNQNAIKNWWFGTTINSNEDIQRIPYLPLMQNRFISIEPLLGPIDFSIRYPQTRIPMADWIIVGAQTGPGAVPPKPEWVQSIIDQCREAGVPVFLKNNLYWPEKIQEYPVLK